MNINFPRRLGILGILGLMCCAPYDEAKEIHDDKDSSNMISVADDGSISGYNIPTKQDPKWDSGKDEMSVSHVGEKLFIREQNNNAKKNKN